MWWPSWTSTILLCWEYTKHGIFSWPRSPSPLFMAWIHTSRTRSSIQFYTPLRISVAKSSSLTDKTIGILYCLLQFLSFRTLNFEFSCFPFRSISFLFQAILLLDYYISKILCNTAQQIDQDVSGEFMNTVLKLIPHLLFRCRRTQEIWWIRRGHCFLDSPSASPHQFPQGKSPSKFRHRINIFPVFVWHLSLKICVNLFPNTLKVMSSDFFEDCFP